MGLRSAHRPNSASIAEGAGIEARQPKGRFLLSPASYTCGNHEHEVVQLQEE